MAVDGTCGRRRGKREDLAQVWRMSVSGLTRMGRPNPSRETKFLGANGDREQNVSCSADHEQDWQPYPVDPTLLNVLTIHNISCKHPQTRALAPLWTSTNCAFGLVGPFLLFHIHRTRWKATKLLLLYQLLGKVLWPVLQGSCMCVCVCVCVLCFLPIHFGHQVRWTYQPGSHGSKVTQDFSSTFFLRCVP